MIISGASSLPGPGGDEVRSDLPDLSRFRVALRPAELPLPLQLLARSLTFTDPFTGQERAFRSGQHLAPGAPLTPSR